MLFISTDSGCCRYRHHFAQNLVLIELTWGVTLGIRNKKILNNIKLSLVMLLRSVLVLVISCEWSCRYFL